MKGLFALVVAGFCLSGSMGWACGLPDSVGTDSSFVLQHRSADGSADSAFLARQDSLPVPAAEGGKSFKLGHVRSMEVTNRLPQMDSVIRALQDYGRKLASNLKAMTAEYNAKYVEFQAKESAWPELVKESKERELEELWKRLQDFERQSKEDYAKQSEALILPLTGKVRAAIEAVAEEGGFSYILDASNGMLFLGPGAEDVTPLVEAKLGLCPIRLPADSTAGRRVQKENFKAKE